METKILLCYWSAAACSLHNKVRIYDVFLMGTRACLVLFFGCQVESVPCL